LNLEVLKDSDSDEDISESFSEEEDDEEINEGEQLIEEEQKSLEIK